MVDFLVGDDELVKCDVDPGGVIGGETELAEAVEVVVEIEGFDGAGFVLLVEVLDVGVVGAGLAPAFDAGDVGLEVAVFGGLVGPDLAVAADDVVFFGADPEGGGPVDSLFKGGGDADEFGDPVAPAGADDFLAEAGGDAVYDVLHEGVVAGVGAVGERSGVEEGGFGGGRVVLDSGGDFDAPFFNVTEDVPPFGLVGKVGVSYTRNESLPEGSSVRCSKRRRGERGTDTRSSSSILERSV